MAVRRCRAEAAAALSAALLVRSGIETTLAMRLESRHWREVLCGNRFAALPNNYGEDTQPCVGGEHRGEGTDLGVRA